MPPGPNTDSSEVIATYIYTKLNNPTNKTALGLVDVWYGDQDLLPHTPAACVAPGTKQRQFQGATFRTLNTLTTYILVYYGKIQDVQQNLHSATSLADNIETLIHSDLLLGGNVVSVLCTQNEPGMISKAGALLMGARMTFESQSYTTLPQQVV
jgi:hypothetical protein